MTHQPIRSSIRILGIDPGLRRTGWGVIEVHGNRLGFIGCGSVEPSDGLPLASRLLAIHEGLAGGAGGAHPYKTRFLVMLKTLLPRAEPMSSDAADALAIAITHAHHRQSAAL